MATTDPVADFVSSRPKRADALRNYEKILSAARETFTEHGSSTSLEEIARRAEVGIGTLYRHFPTRQALLEAVYLDEVNELCASAARFAELEPWPALEGWLHRFVEYMATKQALASELLDYLGRDSTFFAFCRTGMFEAGEPLIARAKEAGVMRADTSLAEVIQMFGGIAKIQGATPEQVEHIIQIALDGLRAQPA